MDRLLSYKVFTRVADHASFARAAQELGISAATVSAHVAQLEGHLGVTLLNRTTRSVSLTDEGRDFHERVARILADVQAAEDAFCAADKPLQGRLRVDVSPTAAVHVRIAMELAGDLACGTQEACALSSALGMGVTQVLSYAAREHVAAGRLKPVLADWAAQGPPVQVVYPRSRVLSPRVRAFVDYLAEAITPETLSGGVGGDSRRAR